MVVEGLVFSVVGAVLPTVCCIVVMVCVCCSQCYRCMEEKCKKKLQLYNASQHLIRAGEAFEDAGLELTNEHQQDEPPTEIEQLHNASQHLIRAGEAFEDAGLELTNKDEPPTEIELLPRSQVPGTNERQEDESSPQVPGTNERQESGNASQHSIHNGEDSQLRIQKLGESLKSAGINMLQKIALVQNYYEKDNVSNYLLTAESALKLAGLAQNQWHCSEGRNGYAPIESSKHALKQL